MLASSAPAPGAHTIVRALAHARKLLLAQVRTVAGEPDERFPAAFVHLSAAVEAAFRREEALMEATGFSGVHEQRRDNALLLNALHHAVPLVEAGDLGVGRAVVAALPDLLSLHRFCGLRVLATARGAVLALRRGRVPGPLAGRAAARLAARRQRQAEFPMSLPTGEDR
ncbi:hypothetical protein [Massilia sp. UBA6681]|uniref:hypothetical protein n=1 Tax=Massilia sp. UBA6681 TaxID=1946839 RepID=UPI0025C09A4A|nr:hypothetical protein [Massilia sp. UBA6681]